MSNLVADTRPRVFWVWVDPEDFLVRHNITFAGSFTSTPIEPGAPAMMFLPNPAFKTFLGPFQNNLLRAYVAEYNLESTRVASFPHYPCRLQAIFLLGSEAEALSYSASHPEHVRGRVLKRARSAGPYTYSTHDSSWVDFLRLHGSKDAATLQAATEAYWSGRSVRDAALESMGQPWTRDRVDEVLFLGRVDFEDRRLDG